ncbi:MAG: hypothetical protein SOY17_09460 [Evtepia sp.]|nr:hypothetical protein [Evtepia sp.]
MPLQKICEGQDLSGFFPGCFGALALLKGAVFLEEFSESPDMGDQAAVIVPRADI